MYRTVKGKSGKKRATEVVHVVPTALVLLGAATPALIPTMPGWGSAAQTAMEPGTLTKRATDTATALKSGYTNKSALITGAVLIVAGIAAKKGGRKLGLSKVRIPLMGKKWRFV